LKARDDRSTTYQLSHRQADI